MKCDWPPSPVAVTCEAATPESGMRCDPQAGISLCPSSKGSPSWKADSETHNSQMCERKIHMLQSSVPSLQQTSESRLLLVDGQVHGAPSWVSVKCLERLLLPRGCARDNGRGSRSCWRAGFVNRLWSKSWQWHLPGGASGHPMGWSDLHLLTGTGFNNKRSQHLKMSGLGATFKSTILRL